MRWCVLFCYPYLTISYCIGKDVATCSAQTYQNYKSALKWFHELSIVDEKQGILFPRDVDMEIGKQIQAYKREVGDKKRRGTVHTI